MCRKTRKMMIDVMVSVSKQFQCSIWYISMKCLIASTRTTVKYSVYRFTKKKKYLWFL